MTRSPSQWPGHGPVVGLGRAGGRCAASATRAGCRAPRAVRHPTVCGAARPGPQRHLARPGPRAACPGPGRRSPGRSSRAAPAWLPRSAAAAESAANLPRRVPSPQARIGRSSAAAARGPASPVEAAALYAVERSCTRRARDFPAGKPFPALADPRDARRSASAVALAVVPLHLPPPRRPVLGLINSAICAHRLRRRHSRQSSLSAAVHLRSLLALATPAIRIAVRILARSLDRAFN